MRVPLQFGTGFRRFTKHFAKPKSGRSKASSSGRGSMEEEEDQEEDGVVGIEAEDGRTSKRSKSRRSSIV